MRSLVVLVALLGLSVAHSASAFCGFFVAGSNQDLSNDASKVVLMRKGTRTALTMSNNYKGPLTDFAMVVPVPVVLHEKDVKTLAPSVFDHIDQLSAPRLVEYWEKDPCMPEMSFPKGAIGGGAMPPPTPSAPPQHGLGVTVEAQFAVGEYQIVILSAKEANGLEEWLRMNHYNIPAGASAALAPYIKSQMKFFVAKVDIAKVHRDAKNGVVLSPLRVIYEAPELRLPVRLGLLNSHGKQDLIVYVLHPTSRFEVANYTNVFAPTNLEVLDQVRTAFASFYAQLFDETMAHANNRAVVTEYAWRTSSCDPCPVPPLSKGDLATLGDDVLSGNTAKAQNQSTQPDGYYGDDFADWVLTRLHTRYGKETLSEDLVFAEAKPVVGGRAQWNGQSIDPPGDAKPDSENNFQARYIIRHYWNKPVACKSPVYDRWGGPPNGGSSAPQAARDLSSAPRGAIALRKVVRSKLPKLGLPGLPPPAHRAQ